MTRNQAGAWAREFEDPASGTTWRVRLIRPTPATEPSLWGGRVGPLVLQFENGVETRRLEPAPLDWRECDEAALWRYCQSAQLAGIRRALAGDNGIAAAQSPREKPASDLDGMRTDEHAVACPDPVQG